MFSAEKGWVALERPHIKVLPRPVFVRASHLPARSYFPPHKHPWDQLVYASSGVLMVNVDRKSFVIPPEQAVWLPAEWEHSTSSLSGGEFRSLYIDPAVSRRIDLSGECRVISASALVRELIIKAADFPPDYNEDGYEGRIISILLEEVSRMPEIGTPLPWPQTPRLRKLCEDLYQNPADSKSMTQWGRDLGASSRTLARHLELETGLSYREWRHRLRLLKALEYLGDGINVTGVGLMLGYSSTSAFIHMFRKEYGCTPLGFLKQHSLGKPNAPRTRQQG